MLPDSLALGDGARLQTAGLSSPWAGALTRLGLALITIILLFLPDWQAMVTQWWDSSTYNHILLVPAIVGWLIWQRVPQLAKLAPQGWWPGLLVCGFAGLVWLLGAVSGLDLARQAGAVALLPAITLTLLGPRIGWGLLFPMAYLVFLIPVGEELVPVLQTVTAEITIILTRLSGIPAAINGVFIDTPAGLFVVAEACSGVKFLIAMIAFGVLVSNVCFRSWTRRLLFLAVAVIVPILANGVRAWGTIYLAQHYGTEWAGGFDHIVYGWVFFAVVIAMVLALAWRHFDRSPEEPFIDAAQLTETAWLTDLSKRRIAPFAAVLSIAAIIGATHAWAIAADRLAAPMPKRLNYPEVAGWQLVNYTPTLHWQPRASGSDHHMLGSFKAADGRVVEVFFALYSAQRNGKEAGGFGENAVTPGSAWDWTANGPAIADARTERLLGLGKIERSAETYFRTGDLLTGSNSRLKLATMRDRMLLRERPTSLLILSAESRPGQPGDAAIAAFRKSIGPIDVWMDRVAQVR